MYTVDSALSEFAEHGEIWIQQKLQGKLNTIFDVGANIGAWTMMSRQYNPQAEFHLFELVPQTYKLLLDTVATSSKIVPNGFGLADEYKTVPVQYVPQHPELSTQYYNLRLDSAETVTGIVIPGDDYVVSRNVQTIDYLKIDVEGAEGKVLRGFTKALTAKRIGIIQFEYSYHALLDRWLLVDWYTLLRPLGYHLGKLTPTGIQFHEYTYRYETFNGPDYVAVHETKMNLFE